MASDSIGRGKFQRAPITEENVRRQAEAVAGLETELGSVFEAIAALQIGPDLGNAQFERARLRPQIPEVLGDQRRGRATVVIRVWLLDSFGFMRSFVWIIPPLRPPWAPDRRPRSQTS